MTAWTSILNGQIDTDSPVTQSLMTALRDNPIAVSEGSTDAPVAQAGWHPYNMVFVADGNDGKFYDHATHGTVASANSPSLADGYEYAMLVQAMTISSGTSNTLSVQAYHDGAAAWATLSQLVNPGAVAVSGLVILPIPRLSRASTTTGTGLTTGTTGKFTLMRVFATSTITAGRAYLLRKREFGSA